jgi:hypothetical protein
MFHIVKRNNRIPGNMLTLKYVCLHVSFASNFDKISSRKTVGSFYYNMQLQWLIQVEKEVLSDILMHHACRLSTLSKLESWENLATSASKTTILLFNAEAIL